MEIEEKKKPTYEELEKELSDLKKNKIFRQKNLTGHIRKILIELQHLMGANKVPVSIDFRFDYDKDDWKDYVADSMIPKH